jgi:hypothetical protein
MTRVLAVIIAVAVTGVVCLGVSGAAPAFASEEQPEIAFRLTDRRIAESSGLAASTKHAGVTWTHNDSGGGPRLYAVDRRGRTIARLTLAGLDPYDWEGLAAGSDHTLWIGDIGDNSQRRETIALFRVAEPEELDDGEVEWTRFRFRYPDGPHDAEAVLVHPRTGRVYVATKEIVGGGLYAGPERLGKGEVNDLTRVADVPPLVTDGAFAPDGSLFALRGYLSAWLYAAPGDQVDRVGLPEMEQGESVTFSRDGRALLAGTEGENSPVWRVPLPKSVATGASGTTSATERPSGEQGEGGTGEQGKQGGGELGEQSAAAEQQDRQAAPAPSVVPMLAAGAGVAALLTTIGVTLRRRPTRGRR